MSHTRRSPRCLELKDLPTFSFFSSLPVPYSANQTGHATRKPRAEATSWHRWTWLPTIAASTIAVVSTVLHRYRLDGNLAARRSALFLLLGIGCHGYVEARNEGGRICR